VYNRKGQNNKQWVIPKEYFLGTKNSQTIKGEYEIHNNHSSIDGYPI
jgi:hypothetical protein